MARSQRTGGINQQNTKGVTIAHTGKGDVILQLGQSARSLPQSVLTVAGITPAVAVRNTLLRDVVNLIGRDSELNTILAGAGEADHSGRPMIYAITGMPGIGKTSLAVHAAHRLPPRFPDGQPFIPCNEH